MIFQHNTEKQSSIVFLTLRQAVFNDRHLVQSDRAYMQ